MRPTDGTAACKPRLRRRIYLALRLWAKQIIWHLDGRAGRSITFWIKVKGLRYNVCVPIAERVCRGPHTDGWYSRNDRRCLCDRVRRHCDFIPF